jgi:SAM-dependent methyltransferase
MWRKFTEEKTLYFNNNAKIYDDIRPGYPDEVYEIISKHKIFNKNSNILEIGAGNGMASLEIYNKWSPKLALIEPGNILCELLYQKFNGNRDITIENTTFEKYQNKILFDAVFSATAFHWLDLAVKYKKTHEILKDDGLLIVYWNNYGIENNEAENKIQSIYTKYKESMNDGRSVYERQMEKIETRKKEINESGYFKIADHKIIKKVRKYTADDYIKLLKTFPDHSEMPGDFFDEVKETIMGNRNAIDARIIINLEIAKKV